jgi:hypothetical protein
MQKSLNTGLDGRRPEWSTILLCCNVNNNRCLPRVEYCQVELGLRCGGMCELEIRSVININIDKWEMGRARFGCSADRGCGDNYEHSGAPTLKPTTARCSRIEINFALPLFVLVLNWIEWAQKGHFGPLRVEGTEFEILTATHKGTAMSSKFNDGSRLASGPGRTWSACATEKSGRASVIRSGDRVQDEHVHRLALERLINVQFHTEFLVQNVCHFIDTLAHQRNISVRKCVRMCVQII